jgi:hypothetical protein
MRSSHSYFLQAMKWELVEIEGTGSIAMEKQIYPKRLPQDLTSVSTM